MFFTKERELGYRFGVTDFGVYPCQSKPLEWKQFYTSQKCSGHRKEEPAQSLQEHQEMKEEGNPW